LNIKEIEAILTQFTVDKQLTKTEELLLNIIEYLLQENQKQKEEVQVLKDENRRLKGEQGRPNIKANTRPNIVDTEKERSEPAKPHKKEIKKDKIPIHRTETRDVDKSILPSDAIFKGYDDVPIQNIRIIPDNILFKLECWYSPSQKKTYRVPVDPEYTGSEFSPELRAYIIDLSVQGRMSQLQIFNILTDKGFSISEGAISNILSKNLDTFHQEIDAVYQAGLESSPYHQTDDTGARHQGKNGSTMVVAGPLYTVFFTSKSKNRLQVLQNFSGNNKLRFLFNEETIALLKNEKLSSWVYDIVSVLSGNSYDTEDSIEKVFTEKSGKLPSKPQWSKILYYSALIGYLKQDEYAHVNILVADDAPQFQILSILVQLCWVHLGRNFKVLNPRIERHRLLLDSFLKDFWEYYHRLNAFKLNPTKTAKKILDQDFDLLFDKTTGYSELDDLLAIKKVKKASYLVVLDHPEIPIHNNHSEQQIRIMVQKRNISHGTRSDAGRKARDTLTGLMLTCRKLGVSFWDYLIDRLKKAGEILPLDEIIRQRATSSTEFQ
jgi:hypothetical protein